MTAHAHPAPTSASRRRLLLRGLQWGAGAGSAGVLGLGLPTAAATTANPTATGSEHTATPPAASAAAAALHALFARSWDESARLSPEWATYRGDHRFGDRFSDLSPEGVDLRDRRAAAWLAEAEAIAPQALGAQDRLSRSLFIHNMQRQLQSRGFEGWRQMGLGSHSGVHNQLAGLLQAMPADKAEQAEQVLARLAAYPAHVAQHLTRLERSLALGWVPAREVLLRSRGQLQAQLAQPPRQGPFFEPFRRLGRQIAAPQREALQARAEAAIQTAVLPALQRVLAFLDARYLPAAPDEGGLLRRPQGEAVYALLVQQHTTTALSPQAVHAMGLELLDALHADFAALRTQANQGPDFAAQVAGLRAPEQFFPNPEAMLDGYRAVAKQLDAQMPALFFELPRVPYGIRPMPAHLGPGAADNYVGPPADGSRPGWYNANILAYQRRPRWALPTLVAHETVPGHHLQIGRARELQGLPDFRRMGGYTAFSEGWGLYAERLMDEQGFYDTPASRFGHLQAQAFRAARLVVDTGLHALGWSRERALQTLVDRVGESPVFMSAEVDRYLSNPGQALAYMVGQQQILALRREAQAAMGARFDLRRFHNAVIDQGALPLPVLAEQIKSWMAAPAAV